MIYPVGHAHGIQSSKVFEEQCTSDSGPDSFRMSMADELLRSTWQYPRWKTLRQQDPERADKVAHIVLERHTYVTGKAAPTEKGREHFDYITDQLKREGIYLYRSHEFKNPIFPDIQVGKTRKVAAPEAAAKTQEVEPNQRALLLNRRFAHKDCFEFLVGIFEDNGITYYGKEGVKCALMEKGQSQGKDFSAYLTGEGVTQLLCLEPVTIRVQRVTEHSFDEVWSKIERHLREGAILSYSSQYFGHTGILSQTNGRWVYINSSGSAGDSNTYRVVEEDLKHEISGWLRRAERGNTFLNITLGAVNRDLAARFSKWNLRVPGAQSPDINLLA